MLRLLGDRWTSGVEDLVAGRAQGGLQCSGEHGIGADRGHQQLRPRYGEIGELVLDEAAQAFATCGDDTTGEHDQLGVDDRDDGGQSDGQPVRELREYGVARAFGLQRGRDRGFRRTGLEAVFAGEFQDRFAAGELLEAAGVVAADVADQRRTRERQERDLTRATGRAAVQPAVDHDRGADAFLAPEQHEVVVLAGVADALPGDRGQVDVVLDLQRYADRGGQLLEQMRRVPAGQVGRVPQAAGRRVETTRRTDRDPVQAFAIQARLAGCALDRFDHPVDRALGAAARRGQLVLADHLAGQVRHCGPDPGRRDVEAGDVRDAAVDLVQLRVRARATGGGAALADQVGSL